MPGWNGAGVFVLPYSMVAEAASGIKILASHQDTQWNAVKAGLENCLTRDGQNSPSTDIPWNNKKITGLAAPINGTDATNKTYVDATQASEWLQESYAVSYNAANKFNVIGVNLTTKYVAGRRLKILHTNGTVTAYATVASSTFTGGNTVVTVLVDYVWAVGALFATVTAVYASLITPGVSGYGQSWQQPRSMVAALLASTVFGVTAPMAKVGLYGYYDTNEEFNDVTNRLTFRYAGRFMVSAQATWVVTTAGVAHIQVKYNGSTFMEMYQYLPVNVNPQTVSISAVVNLFGIGDYLEMYAGGVAGDMWGDASVYYTCLNAATLV
jgi:hypothetical protein